MNLMTVDAALKGLPVRVSERRFRAVARRIGRFKMKGREMCVTASDVEAILLEMTHEGRRREIAKTQKLTEPDLGGYVYFIDLHEYTKIGFSKWHPKNGGRQNTLGTTSPYALRLWAFARGPMELERFLHKTYANRRVKGEWFRLAPFDRREMARLARRTKGYVNKSPATKNAMRGDLP
jgi:hypothetical protein